MSNAANPSVVRVGLIGSGRIGSSHADLIHRRVPGAELAAVADAFPEAAAAARRRARRTGAHSRRADRRLTASMRS